LSDDINEFHSEFLQEIAAKAGANGQYKQATFTELYGEYLVDAGEFDSFTVAHHKSIGIALSGWAGDPAECNDVLALVISDWSELEEVSTLGQADVTNGFKRLEAFIKASFDETWCNKWEEASPGYQVAELIHQRKSSIKSIRLYILSNKKLSNRIKDHSDNTLFDIPIQYRPWDIVRLKNLVESGREREEMVVDLKDDFKMPLPCLSVHSVNCDDYKAYLAVVPGELLARVYERWGPRLLEQNVRSFLQARGKVNKGMKETISTDPGMFFAYNNGITATAEEIETEVTPTGLQIIQLKNLQIVNGGQTTASIFTAGRGKQSLPLNNVFVQMKLSVVAEGQRNVIVPNISRFANSQNKVSEADFFSNHPYHVFMEAVSRKLWTPTAGYSAYPTRWFYERSRGQYNDALSRQPQGAKRNAFKKHHPSKQKFTKTDLAKFLNVWEELPHTVSQGSQKNFKKFAGTHVQRWSQDKNQFNELYFKETIGKAIVFRATEKLVSAQPWYEGGYRANIVAYTLSRLARELKAHKKTINFEDIWNQQTIPQELEGAIKAIAKLMQEHLLRPPEGIKNISEYAKKPFCWDSAKSVPVLLPASLQNKLQTLSVGKDIKQKAKKEQKIIVGINAQTRVVNLGQSNIHFWKYLYRFGQAKQLFSPKDSGIISTIMRQGYGSDKQSEYALRLLARCEDIGFDAKNPERAD
jgi:hypothetical protein